MAWGASGVDIFFVISGFLMMYIQAERPKSPQAFLWNRAVRIVPLYWGLTTCMIGLQLAAPSAFTAAKMDLGHILQSFGFISSIIASPPILHVGWSLEYEMLFYLIFALSLFFRQLTCGAFFVAASLIVLVIFSLLQPIAFEFLAGMGLWFVLKNRHIGVRPFFGLCCLCIWAIGLMLGTAMMEAGQWRIVYWGVPSLALVVGCLTLPQKSWRWALFLGNASYAIYLVQVFTLPAFYKVVTLLNFPEWGNFISITAVVFTLAFGGLVHVIAERPIGRLIWKMTQMHRNRAAI